MLGSWKQKGAAILDIGIHQRGPNMIGVPHLNPKDSFQGLPNSPFFSFFP
jgi:hypothetical protein